MNRVLFKNIKAREAPVTVCQTDQMTGNGMSIQHTGNLGTTLTPSITGIEAPGFAADAFQLTAEESETLLRIVKTTSRVKRHLDLFTLLQGEVQRVIPHDILIAAWGDLRGAGSTPNVDLVSAIQGVRTGQIADCDGIERMIKDLHARWVAHGRKPMLLSNAAAKPITHSTCGCALHLAMQDMQSVLVHWIRDERDQIDNLYVAMRSVSIQNGHSADRFFFLADSVMAQIDVAYRKVAALKPGAICVSADARPRSRLLSVREEEIIKWISEGKTNVEIAKILGISSFTVKNHAQRIFRKLGVANRTGAVAKYNGDLPA